MYLGGFFLFMSLHCKIIFHIDVTKRRNNYLFIRFINYFFHQYTIFFLLGVQAFSNHGSNLNKPSQ